jgi:hypothetical protein
MSPAFFSGIWLSSAAIVAMIHPPIASSRHVTYTSTKVCFLLRMTPRPLRHQPRVCRSLMPLITCATR